MSRFGSSAPKCPTCTKSVYAAEEVKGPGGKSWHQLCFCCQGCGKSMRGGEWTDSGGNPSCHTCHNNQNSVFGPRGSVSTSPVPSTNTPVVASLALADPSARPAALTTSADAQEEEDTSKQISLKDRMAALQASQAKDAALSKEAGSTAAAKRSSTGGYAGGQPSAPKCPVCSKSVYPNEEVKGPLGKSWHTLCFCCKACSKSMRGGQWCANGGDPYCQTCHGRLFSIQFATFGRAPADTGVAASSSLATTTPEEDVSASPSDVAEVSEGSGAQSLKERTAAFQAALGTGASSADFPAADTPPKVDAEVTHVAAGTESDQAANAETDVKLVQPEADVAQTADEAVAVQKEAQEEAFRKASEEEAARKAAEGAARKLAEKEEEVARNAAEQAAAKAADEEVAQKAAEEAARQLAEDEAAKKAAEETAARAAEEELVRKAAEEAARHAAEEEAARNAAAAEDAARKTAEEAAHKLEEEQPAVVEAPKAEVAPQTQPEAGTAPGPCCSYRLNVAGANFGDCRCGFPKRAHGERQAEAEILEDQTPAVEVAAEVCSSYRLNVAGAHFGDCKCGFPKSAHGVKRQADEEILPEQAPAAEVAVQPCASYRLNVAGAHFGDCKCGFPKSAHGAQRQADEEVLQEKEPEPEVAAQPCQSYRLNAAGRHFGDCKCGHPKNAHGVERDEGEDMLPEQPVEAEVAADPCSQYRLNVAGRNFGDCKCGHPKGAHQIV